MPQRYTNIVFSKHARERMELRQISEDMVLRTIDRPDRTYLEDDGDTKFICTLNGIKLHVVCKPVPEEGKWLVKSTWVRGEDDHGNRVDGRGYYRGRVKRSAPRSPSQTHPFLLNEILFATLIILAIVLIYFLSR